MKEKKSRKAQGLSINVIIIAALALIVLFVLIYIFSTQSGKSIKTIQSCVARGGDCTPISEGCSPGEFEDTSIECANVKEICCVNILKE